MDRKALIIKVAEKLTYPDGNTTILHEYKGKYVKGGLIPGHMYSVDKEQTTKTAGVLPSHVYDGETFGENPGQARKPAKKKPSEVDASRYFDKIQADSPYYMG